MVISIDSIAIAAQTVRIGLTDGKEHERDGERAKEHTQAD